MITVLVVVGKLTIGGAERVCRDIGYFGDSACFQFDYLVFGNEVGAYELELSAKGCRIYHWKSPGSNHLRYYRNLVQLIREKHYDVVHCHTMFNSGIVLRAAKHCEVPIRIAHSHSIRGPEHRGVVKNLYEKTMRSWIQQDATHYIGCGKEAGNWLFGESFFQQHGMILLNGIDLEQFQFNSISRASIRKKHGLEEQFVVGHVGHLAPVKNQIFLLRLMPHLLKRHPNAHLLLLGEGSDRAMLEQEINHLGIGHAVTMTGNVSNVNEYLSAMDVFAFPSLYEGTPLSIIEVQANGLPCILSNQVPRDVFLTDLLHPLSLENSQSEWIEALLCANRHDPERYLHELQGSDFALNRMLEKIYSIYQGNQP